MVMILSLAVIDLGDRGVQRGGLAAAGRAGHQQHAVGLARQGAAGSRDRAVVEAEMRRGAGP